jgi:hypothetical protein
MRNLIPLTALLALAVAACGSSSASDSPQPVEGRATDGPFGLVIQASKSAYAAGEPILARAVLVYSGPDLGHEVSGSGSGPVMFLVEQVGGRIRTGGAVTADCAQYRLEPGRLMVLPFRKSGGFDADDPDAAFLREFLDDPQFRLPVGTWRIIASGGFIDGPGCDGESVDLSASVTIEVR